MTKKHYLTRIVCIALTACIAAICCSTLVACNKKKNVGLSDIFTSATSAREFSSYEREFTLQEGSYIYTSSVRKSDSKNTSANAHSDVGYIKEANAFVIIDRDPTKNDNTGNLSIVKCGDERVYFDGGMPGMILPFYIGVSALRIKDGLVACKFSNGEAGVFDLDGRTVISRKRIGATESKALGEKTEIDVAVKILGSGLVAVGGQYDVQGVNNYTSIYRPTTSGGLETRGELVCRVSNYEGKLSYVDGFDNKYVSVVGNEAGDCMYSIPQYANGTPRNLSGSANGTVVSTGQKNYFSEILYMGNGKFFIHEDWTVAKTDEYTYYDGFDYYVFNRRIYQPDNDSSTEYTANADKVFLYMTNYYYSSERLGVDTSSYLKDGFTYASYGLTIIDKVGFYDQFILDSNMNVVMSLTGNYGVTIDNQKKEQVGYYDLIMQSVDGYYYIPYMPSQAKVYDKNGNLVGHNTGHHILQQSLSNNLIVAGAQDPDDEDEILYGAYNLRGEDVVPFEYFSLSAFRGAYTIGEKMAENESGINVKTMFIVGSDGKTVDVMSDGSKPLADMATDGNGSSIYKIGCYMYRVDSGLKDSDGKTIYYYGVKNFNPNVNKNTVMPATMRAGCVLYAPASSPEDVFVFEKITDGDHVSYTVYRLI